MAELSDNVTFGDLAIILGLHNDPEIESVTITPQGTISKELGTLATVTIVNTILNAGGFFDFIFGGGHTGSCGGFRELYFDAVIATEPVLAEFQFDANNFVANGVSTPPQVVDKYATFLQVLTNEGQRLFDEYRGRNLLGTTMFNTRFNNWLHRNLELPLLFFTQDWAWDRYLRHDGLLTEVIECCSYRGQQIADLQQRTTSLENLASQIPGIQQALGDLGQRLGTLEQDKIPALQRQIDEILDALVNVFQPQIATLQNQMTDLQLTVIPQIQGVLIQQAGQIAQIQQTMATRAELEQVRQQLVGQINLVNGLRIQGDQELRAALRTEMQTKFQAAQQARSALWAEIAKQRDFATAARNQLNTQLRAKIEQRVADAVRFAEAVRDQARAFNIATNQSLQNQFNQLLGQERALREAAIQDQNQRRAALRSELWARIEARVGHAVQFAEAVRDQARAFNIATNTSLRNQMDQLIGQLRNQSQAADLALQGQLNQLDSLVTQRWQQTQELVAATDQALRQFVTDREGVINARVDNLVSALRSEIAAGDAAIFGQAQAADANIAAQLQAELAAISDYIDAREAFILDAVQGWLADAEAAAIVRENALEQRITDFILGQSGGIGNIQELIDQSVTAATDALRDFLLSNDDAIVSQLQSELAGAVQSINDAFSPQIGSLTDQLNALDLEIQQGLDDLNTSWTGQLQASQAAQDLQFQQQLTEIETDLQQQIDSINTTGDPQLEARLQEIETQLAALDQALQTQTANYDQQLTNIEGRLQEIEQSSIPELRQQLLEQLLELQQQLEGTDLLLQGSINDINQQLQQITGQQLVSLQTQITTLFEIITDTLLPGLTTQADLITTIQVLIDDAIVPRIDQNEICCDELRQWRQNEIDPLINRLAFDVDVLNIWRQNDVDVFILNTTNFITNIDQTIINTLQANCDQIIACLQDGIFEEPGDLCNFGIRAWGTMAECWLNTFTPDPVDASGDLDEFNDIQQLLNLQAPAFQEQPGGEFGPIITQLLSLQQTMLAGALETLPDEDPVPELSDTFIYEEVTV